MSQKTLRRYDVYEEPGGFKGYITEQKHNEQTFISANRIAFVGKVQDFRLRFDNLSHEVRNSTKTLQITLYGEVTNKFNGCCLYSTLLAGGICIWPLFLVCCDCYKSRVMETRELPVEAYTILAHAIQNCQNLQSISILLADSLFDSSKADILEKAMLELPKLTYLKISNLMGGFNTKDKEYAMFDNYFSLLKQNMRINYEFRWGSKIINVDMQTNHTALTLVAEGQSFNK